MRKHREPDAEPDRDADDKRKRGQPFYGAKGSDQNAPMKGDFQQQVTRPTGPGTKPVQRKPVKSGGAYKLPRK